MARGMTTWALELSTALKDNGESWADVESNTMTEEEMSKEFDPGYGGVEGCPFTVWTVRSIYFPCTYDGSEWVGCVSRHPDGKPSNHIGGG